MNALVTLQVLVPLESFPTVAKIANKVPFSILVGGRKGILKVKMSIARIEWLLLLLLLLLGVICNLRLLVDIVVMLWRGISLHSLLCINWM